LALGITTILVLALWLGIAAPLIDFYRDRAETLARQQIVAQHMEQLAATRPALEARAAELAKRVPAANRLSGSIPVATAALQGLVQDIAGSAGASLTSVESLPGEAAGNYRRVGVKLALSASWPVLVHFIQAIEQSGTPMAVDDLQVRGSPAPAAQNQQVLEAGFSVYALAAIDQGAESAAPAASGAVAAGNGGR
jgi:general secretion pathway protein M